MKQLLSNKSAFVGCLGGYGPSQRSKTPVLACNPLGTQASRAVLSGSLKTGEELLEPWSSKTR